MSLKNVFLAKQITLYNSLIINLSTIIDIYCVCRYGNKDDLQISTAFEPLTTLFYNNQEEIGRNQRSYQRLQNERLFMSKIL